MPAKDNAALNFPASQLVETVTDLHKENEISLGSRSDDVFRCEDHQGVLHRSTLLK